MKFLDGTQGAITPAQFEALGPIGQGIVNTDRDLQGACAEPVVDFAAVRALRQDRMMLRNAAAIICRRPDGGTRGAGRA